MYHLAHPVAQPNLLPYCQVDARNNITFEPQTKFIMRKFSGFIVWLFAFAAIFSYQQVEAQFNFVVTQATSDAEVEAWVDTIFLEGVEPQAINNISFSGDYRAVGHFTGGYFFGFTTPEGLVMTSGLADDVDESNVCNSGANASTNNNGVDGDQDLFKAANNTSSNDGCIIEFDFKPTADTVRFSYVFASEEYHDYVTASYNDVFGFFLSSKTPGDSLGPYSNNSKNIALVPGTNLPVSIHNVNFGGGGQTCTGKPTGCTNCQYFNDNSQSTDPNFQKFVYDAYTTAFVAKSAVQQCKWYHIKLAIGDAGDAVFDSGVLLEKGSFNPGNVTGDVEFDHPTVDSLIYESCNNHLAILYFRIAEPMGFPYTFPFEVAGSATRDVDYSLYTTTSSDSVYIPVGALYDSIIIRPYTDGEVEGEEDVKIIYSPQMCNSFSAHKDTSVIIIADNPAFPDTVRFYYTKCEDTLNLTFADMAGGVPPYKFDWLENGSFDSDPYEYNISGTDTSVVYCLLYDTCGHQAEDSAIVIVPEIEVTAGPDKEMCNDPSVTLEGVSDEAQYFYWTATPNDPSLSGQENIPQPTVSPTTTTEYVLTASDNCTHQEKDTTMVLMNGAVANASSNVNEICIGDSVVITVNDAATYQWSATPPDGSLAGQDTNQTIVVYPQQNTTYAISLVNDCGYSADDQLDIVVHLLPNANAGIDDSVCKGLTYLLQAAGGINYNWSSTPYDATLFANGQDTLANPVVTPGQQTQYTYLVLVTNNHGCVAEDSMHLFVKPIPTVDITNSSDSICFGDQVNLNAEGTDILPTWSATPIDPSLTGQENNISITVSPLVTTTYTLSAVATGFDCPATITKTIEVIPELKADFQLEHSRVCQHAPFQIVYSGNASDNATYTWNFDGGVVNTGSNAGPIDLQWDTTGVKTITLQVEEQGCISNTEQQNVEVLPTPVTGFSATPVEGCEPLEVAFTDTTTNTSGFVTYDWHFGSAGSSTVPSPNVTFDKEGVYPVSLLVTSDGDCKSFVERTNYIKVYDAPTATFSADPLETVLDQATIQFSNSSVSSDTLTYSWDFNDGSNSGIKNPSHTYAETGTYNVLLTVVTDNGCEDTYSTEITVHPDFAVFIPNAFTPNGDGLNDKFEVKGVGVKTYNLQIYSRWGELIYESDNLEKQWDAANTPGGTYVYVIHATTLLDKQIEEKGTVTVVK